MSDIQKPTGAVLRRNPERECGQPVAQISIVVDLVPGLQTVSFYCNLPRLHTEACAFVGAEAIVTRRNRPIIRNHP